MDPGGVGKWCVFCGAAHAVETTRKAITVGNLNIFTVNLLPEERKVGDIVLLIFDRSPMSMRAF